MKNYCIAVILFHPTEKEIEKVNFYTRYFKKVYIYDNTPTFITSYQTRLNSNEKVEIISSGTNDGMSVAINNICYKAIDAGYDFCCVMDQDSQFEEKQILKMVSFIDAIKTSDIAIIGPRIVYEHQPVLCHEDEYSVVDWIITSGSFINLKAFKLLPDFDSKFFIDRLEYDFCYSAKAKGFKILRLNNCDLFQSLGSLTVKYRYSFYQHSPVRNYYIFRNRLYFYVYKHKGSLLTRSMRVVLPSIKQITKIVFLEDNKVQKLHYILMSIKDFFLGNFGCFNRNV